MTFDLHLRAYSETIYQVISNKDCQRRKEGAHGINGQRNHRYIIQHQHGKQSGDQQEQRSAWRMWYLEFIGRSNEFRTVPKTCCRFKSDGIGAKSDYKYSNAIR